MKLEEISEFASKEYGLERSLENMEKDWQPLVFEVINFFVYLHKDKIKFNHKCLGFFWAREKENYGDC